MTERAHAVNSVTNVSNVIRNFPTNAKGSLPEGAVKTVRFGLRELSSPLGGAGTAVAMPEGVFCFKKQQIS